MDRQSYTVVGIMSGTSLDGLDILLCRLSVKDNWDYEILKAETIDYTEDWKVRLSSAAHMNGRDLLLLNNEYGTFVGHQINQFLSDVNFKPDLVCSHGHTIFHQPHLLFTYQLGSGAAIMAECRITTISDFRTIDVSLKGQGAPLVPAGDHLLFSGYDFCLNLGGFANISNMDEGKRIASDLCPVNIVINSLARLSGFEYDKNGLLAETGAVIHPLLDALNRLPFYHVKGPKSLGREWVETVWNPVINDFPYPVKDILRTVYEHIAFQISAYINGFRKGKVLVTGGGAFNKFLISLLNEKCQSEIVIPDSRLIKFKEALIFALLGVLRFRNEINCYSSVTGAIAETSTGIVWLAPDEKKNG